MKIVLDIERDKTGGLPRTPKNSYMIIQHFSENLGLFDVWRVPNTDGKRYTWRQGQPKFQSKLYFLLVSEV